MLLLVFQIQVTLLSFSVESEFTFLDYIKGGWVGMPASPLGQNSCQLNLLCRKYKKKKQKKLWLRTTVYKCYYSRNRTTGTRMFFSHYAACVICLWTVNGDTTQSYASAIWWYLKCPTITLIFLCCTLWNQSYFERLSGRYQPRDLSSIEWPDTWLSGLSQEKRVFVAGWFMHRSPLSHHSRLAVTGLTGCCTVDKCDSSGWQYADLRNNRPNV